MTVQYVPPNDTDWTRNYQNIPGCSTSTTNVRHIIAPDWSQLLMTRMDRLIVSLNKDIFGISLDLLSKKDCTFPTRVH